jgi:hypothetical protein
MAGDVPVCPRDHAGSRVVRGASWMQSRICSLAHLCWPDSPALLYSQSDSPGRWRKDCVSNVDSASVPPWWQNGSAMVAVQSRACCWHMLRADGELSRHGHPGSGRGLYN